MVRVFWSITPGEEIGREIRAKPWRCHGYPVPVEHVELLPFRPPGPDGVPLVLCELPCHEPEKFWDGAGACEKTYRER